MSPQLWNFKIKLTPVVYASFVLVCAYNPVVYALSIFEMSSFEILWLKCSPSFVKKIILSGESYDSCLHNNFFTSMTYIHKTFVLTKKFIPLWIRKWFLFFLSLHYF